MLMKSLSRPFLQETAPIITKLEFGHYKMAALKALLFDRLIIIFLFI